MKQILEPTDISTSKASKLISCAQDERHDSHLTPRLRMKSDDYLTTVPV
jgi:hypothetical protein